jgi:hypothetical protein
MDASQVRGFFWFFSKGFTGQGHAETRAVDYDIIDVHVLTTGWRTTLSTYEQEVSTWEDLW